MTVSTINNRKISVTDAAATSFPFDFQLLAEGDFKATHYPDVGSPADLVLSADFTLNAGPWESGGTMTTIGTPLAAGEVVMYRDMDFTQGTDLENNRRYNASVYENALDNLTLLTQKLLDDTERSLKLPLTTTTSGLELPEPEANRALIWNAAADALENLNLSGTNIAYTNFIATFLDDVDALEATSTLKTGYVVDDKAEALTLSLTAADVGRKIFVTSENDGGAFTVRYNATPGTYVDNGGAYNGTIIVPTGGDGTIGIVRDYSGAANIHWFGVTGSGTNADPWLGWDASIQDLVVSAVLPIKEWIFPEGEYDYTNTYTFDDSVTGQTYRDLRITGQGETILQFNGTGEAAAIIGNDNIATVCHLNDIKILGNPNCTNVLRLRRVSRASFKNIKLEESTGDALAMDFCLLNNIENLQVSGADVGVMTTRPSNGIHLYGQSTANTFTNPVIEGVTDIGIYITDGSGSNEFMGGTCESGSGPLKQDYGIKVDALCDRNKFDTVFCEDNAVEDILDFGINTQLINCTGFSPTSSTNRGLHLGGDSESGLALSWGAATIGLAASASAVDDFYNGQAVWIVGGTGSGQQLRIIDYDGATKTATVSENWSTVPDGSSQYEMHGSTNATVTGGMYENILIDNGVLRGNLKDVTYGRISAASTCINNSPSTLISNTHNYQSGSSPAEGGFTLTDSSGAGVTITTTDSVWEKIGRHYHCHFDITFGASASGTGVKLSGLPASIGATSMYGGYITSTNFASTQGLQIAILASTNDFVISDGTTVLTYAAVSGKVFRGTLIFRV